MQKMTNSEGETVYLLTLDEVNRLVYIKVKEVLKVSMILDGCWVQLSAEELLETSVFERRNPTNETFLGM